VKLHLTSLAIFTILNLAATAPSQTAPATSTDEASVAISTLRTSLTDSFRRGDIEGILTHLDPDVVVTWQNGELCKGPDEVRAFYARVMTGDKPIVREIKSDPKVLGRHVHGDWAISWGNLSDHFVLSDGSDLPFNSVFTATIAKRGERWLVTAFHTSVGVFDNPVLAKATKKTALFSGAGGCAVGLLLGLLLGRINSARRSARESQR
jgi:ketosteroid isomerase-like protein